MNRQVNAIAGRLSLRPPQRLLLEILDRVTEIAPPKKSSDALLTQWTYEEQGAPRTYRGRKVPDTLLTLAARFL
jgi:hypothetical protein